MEGRLTPLGRHARGYRPGDAAKRAKASAAQRLINERRSRMITALNARNPLAALAYQHSAMNWNADLNRQGYAT